MTVLRGRRGRSEAHKEKTKRGRPSEGRDKNQNKHLQPKILRTLDNLKKLGQRHGNDSL